MVRFIAAMLAHGFLSTPAVHATQAEARFVEALRCPIASRLVQIRDAPVSDAGSGTTNRFLVVSRRDRPSHYVQCMLFDGGASMLCEAASGVYARGSSDQQYFPLDGAAVSALRNLEFSGDGAQQNYRLEIAIEAAADFTGIARLIAETLYRAYGARDVEGLAIHAPLATDGVIACTPTG